jgi:S-adenosyl-L-methionine hydrolase (adenosine-forming)
VTRPILFLSDYGLADEFVGVCHAVIARIAPEIRVIDLAHEVPPQDVARGASLLAEAAGYAPDDTLYLAIVDPGVGTDRRPIVVAAGRSLLVGPDNGVLSRAWKALGGASRAFEITAPEVMLERVSATFHGRDVFSPAAARLARGMPPEDVGAALDLATLQQVRLPRVRTEQGHVHCKVFGIDRFGNVQLSARPPDLEEAGLSGHDRIQVRVEGYGHDLPLRTTYGEVPAGKGIVIVDSGGFLTVAVNRGSAAETLGVAAGDHIVLAAPAASG